MAVEFTNEAVLEQLALEKMILLQRGQEHERAQGSLAELERALLAVQAEQAKSEACARARAEQLRIQTANLRMHAEMLKLELKEVRLTGADRQAERLALEKACFDRDQLLAASKRQAERLLKEGLDFEAQGIKLENCLQTHIAKKNESLAVLAEAEQERALLQTNRQQLDTLMGSSNREAVESVAGADAMTGGMRELRRRAKVVQNQIMELEELQARMAEEQRSLVKEHRQLSDKLQKQKFRALHYAGRREEDEELLNALQQACRNLQCSLADSAHERNRLEEAMRCEEEEAQVLVQMNTSKSRQLAGVEQHKEALRAGNSLMAGRLQGQAKENEGLEQLVARQRGGLQLTAQCLLYSEHLR